MVPLPFSLPGLRHPRLAALLLAGAAGLACPRPAAAFSGSAPAATASPAAHAAPSPSASAVSVAASPAPRAWELTGNLRTSVGYKENLLLSSVRSVDRPFAQTVAEVFLWRLPDDRFEALAFTHATATRFVSAPDHPTEWQAFAHAEGRWFASPRLQLQLVAEGYHLDQVFDLSATDAERATARLSVDGGLASVALRAELPAGLWLELKPTAQRDRYDDGGDDHRQRLGRLTLGREFLAGRLRLALSTQVLRRAYDRRPRYTVAGRPVAGTRLAFRQHEHEARATVAWDRAQHWTSVTALALGANRDDGSGYFDYRQRHLRHELAWSRAPWQARLTGRAARFDYDVQTEGIGINPPFRLKEEFRVAAHVARTLSARTAVFSELVWERSRSNDPLANYRVRTVSTGLDWSF